MAEALRTADRLTHFLWASLILGSFFSLEGRMNEAYVTVSSCVELAIACGLDIVHFRHRTRLVQNPLLPPPADTAESIDRATLSRAIYILDRTLAMIHGTPSAFSGASGPYTRSALNVEADQNGAPSSFSVTTEVCPTIFIFIILFWLLFTLKIVTKSGGLFDLVVTTRNGDTCLKPEYTTLCGTDPHL